MTPHDLTREQHIALLNRLDRDAGYYGRLLARMRLRGWPERTIARVERARNAIDAIRDDIGPLPTPTFDPTFGHENWRKTGARNTEKNRATFPAAYEKLTRRNREK